MAAPTIPPIRLRLTGTDHRYRTLMVSKTGLLTGLPGQHISGSASSAA